MSACSRPPPSELNSETVLISMPMVFRSGRPSAPRASAVGMDETRTASSASWMWGMAVFSQLTPAKLAEPAIDSRADCDWAISPCTFARSMPGAVEEAISDLMRETTFSACERPS